MQVNAQAPVGESTGAVATVPKAPVGLRSADVGGIKIPRLEVTHGVGGLFERGFPAGALVLHKEEQLAAINTPLLFLAVECSTYVKDRLTREEFSAKVQSQRYANMADAKAAGRIVAWPPRGVEGPKPNVTEAADVRMLIQQPEGVLSDWFNIAIGGKLYAACDFTADKAGYGPVSEPLLRRMRSLEARRAQFLAKNPGAEVPEERPVFFKLWTQVVKKPTYALVVPYVGVAQNEKTKTLMALDDTEMEDLKRLIASIKAGQAAGDDAAEEAPF